MRQPSVPVEDAKTLSDLARAVNDEVRVGVIKCMDEKASREVEVGEIAEEVAGWLGHERRRIQIALLHQHIPKLEKYDIAHREDERIRKGENFGEAVKFLTCYLD